MKEEIRSELVDLSDEDKVEFLLDMVVERNEMIIDLKKRLDVKGKGRKQELFEILNEGGSYSILDLSKKMEISNRNVSSLLSYLRADGVKICSDEKGRKFIR